ncbi:MAG: FCD domain-containing protein [Actinobacteria bacterium]|nr:FCD domain-containing protein [Actinomycetota bacterium]
MPPPTCWWRCSAMPAATPDWRSACRRCRPTWCSVAVRRARPGPTGLARDPSRSTTADRACRTAAMVRCVLESKSERAYQVIRLRLLDGTYGPGDRIVLPEVGAELAMSVVPVREAVRRLEAEGLLEFTRWAGARVPNFDERQLAEAIEAAALLEGEIARLAAPYLRREDLTAMRRENRLLRSAETSGDLEDARARDRAFHAVVHARCPNRLLVLLVETAYVRMDTLRNVFEHQPQRVGNATAEHQRLIEFLAARPDADEVGRAFRQHGLDAAAEIARWDPTGRHPRPERIRSNPP